MRRTLTAVGLLAAPPALADGLLSPMGPIAEAQRQHLIEVTAITMIAVLPVLIGVPLILWRYRRGRGGAYAPRWEFSGPVEIAMWGGPLVIVGVLGLWLWRSTMALDPYRALGPDPLRIEVIGLDWKWLFIYPDQGIASLDMLAIPEGRPVSLHLTTDTVMQSFMVPALAGQIYAMPGMVSQLNLQADRTGTTEGANMQFNGPGFAGQRFTVAVMAAADWQAWASGAGDAPVLDAAAYDQIARPGPAEAARQALALPDTRMTLARQDLFQQVVHRYHGGQPVPAEAQPGTTAYRPATAGSTE